MTNGKKLTDIIREAFSDVEDTYSLEKVVSKIARIIRVVHRYNGYVGINIYGEQGTGKTLLGLLIMKKTYNIGFNKLIDYVYYDVYDFLGHTSRLAEAIKRRLNGETPGRELLGMLGEVYDPVMNRGLLVMLDDVGAYFSKWRRTQDTIAMLEFLQIIRSIYSAAIFTFVDTSAQKFIRENAKINILLDRVSSNEVIGKVYIRRFTINGIRWERKAVFDYNPSEYFRDPELAEAYKKYWRRRLESTHRKLSELTMKVDMKRNGRR